MIDPQAAQKPDRKWFLFTNGNQTQIVSDRRSGDYIPSIEDMVSSTDVDLMIWAKTAKPGDFFRPQRGSLFICINRQQASHVPREHARKLIEEYKDYSLRVNVENKTAAAALFWAAFGKVEPGYNPHTDTWIADCDE